MELWKSHGEANMIFKGKKREEKKVQKANEARTRVFYELFLPRCQYRHEFDPKQKINVKSNFLKYNISTPKEVE